MNEERIREPLPPIEWREKIADDLVTFRATVEGTDEEVGFVTLRMFDDFMYVGRFKVADGYKNRGMGDLLAKKMGDCMRDNHKIGLLTEGIDSRDKEAKGMFGRRGWTPIPERPSWFTFVPEGVPSPTKEQIDLMFLKL